MIHLRRRRRSMPMLNMAAMPDLIFTILFFFMFVTHMRSNNSDLRYTLPAGQELTQLKNKQAVVHIYIGKQNGWLLQVNNQTVDLPSLSQAIHEACTHLPLESQAQATAVIRADKDVPMQLISDVKQQIRRAKVYRVVYAGVEKPSAR